MDLTFVASGYVMNNLSFQRQIGIGDLFYEVSMNKTAGWQDHLFVTVSPFLQQFILEQNFQMAQAHQLFLGDWLNQQKEKTSLFCIIRKVEDAAIGTEVERPYPELSHFR